MTVTTLDPKTALIVIDMQKGILATPKVHPVDEVVKNVSKIIDTFRSHNLPVVLVNVDGAPSGRNEQGARMGELPEGWTDLIPELNQQESDHLVTKRQWGAFTNTDLNDFLVRMGVTQVVIVGISTSIGVESTARHAHELGFNVNLIVDAMTDTNLDAHINSITRIFPRLGETSATAEIIALLENTPG